MEYIQHEDTRETFGCHMGGYQYEIFSYKGCEVYVFTSVEGNKKLNQNFPSTHTGSSFHRCLNQNSSAWVLRNCFLSTPKNYGSCDEDDDSNKNDSDNIMNHYWEISLCLALSSVFCATIFILSASSYCS